MEKGFVYVYNCVNPDDLEELNYIIDNGEEITREEFLEIVNRKSLKSIETSLGYDSNFKMENDWHVSYWKSVYNGNPIYYFCHSCIEYVFKEKV